jgi:hypothetical protein
MCAQIQYKDENSFENEMSFEKNASNLTITKSIASKI